MHIPVESSCYSFMIEAVKNALEEHGIDPEKVVLVVDHEGVIFDINSFGQLSSSSAADFSGQRLHYNVRNMPVNRVMLGIVGELSQALPGTEIMSGSYFDMQDRSQLAPEHSAANLRGRRLLEGAAHRPLIEPNTPVESNTTFLVINDMPSAASLIIEHLTDSHPDETIRAIPVIIPPMTGGEVMDVSGYANQVTNALLTALSETPSSLPNTFLSELT